ncbi:MAG TPA: tetratricopeptide repeat protein [Solimonas sp.]
MDWTVHREQVTQALLRNAQSHLESGRWDEAESSYQRAQAIEPGNSRAAEGLQLVGRERRYAPSLGQAEAAVEAKDFDAALNHVAQIQAEHPRHPRLRKVLQQIADGRMRDQFQHPVLRAPAPEPVSLEYYDASVRSIFDALSRMSGLGFVFDRDIQSDLRTSITLKQVSPEAAVDLLLQVAQLRKKVLNSETLLVYPNTAEKIRQYEDLMVRGFYLGNTEAKQAEALLRGLLKVESVHVDQRLNLLVMRDTPEAIRLAEKLIAMQDVQEPEVMLEVAVMEVQRSRLTELGIDWPDQVTVTPLNTVGGAGTTWSDLRTLNSQRLRVNSGSAVINLRRELSDSNLLANPRIRARNREQAKILIGDRVPVLTTTSTSTGFVSENVQYLDVGLKLNVEPSVYLSDEVAIKVGLEVGSIVREIRSTSGALTYQIGTRSAETVLRLKDGETQILAGLINDEDRASARRIPGVGDLPILSRLFGSRQDNRSKTEIILSITPRVLRNIERPDAMDSSFWSGTGSRLSTLPLSVPKSALVDVGGSVSSDGSAIQAAVPVMVVDDQERGDDVEAPLISSAKTQ